ncbi:MAG TPA: serine/threonine protein phosphatase, partial [Cyanothece sp. UBA12306]|nr:serine/threonine protein phosphatase [Cyanothece sp. UBA12306]
MILPKIEELENIDQLDLAGYMKPAEDVGGDYYDVLDHNGIVTLGIGDVTGHGLESGILMVMTQAAVRTLKEIGETDPVKFLSTLNRTIYQNVKRMNSEKSMTLGILHYCQGQLSISGQHEEILVVRSGGKIERIDTIDLGIPIGLDHEIAHFIDQIYVQLNPGDGVVLYTDGITEAKDIDKKFYGLERLCQVVSQNWSNSAQKVQQAVIEDVYNHIGQQKMFDDITLLVLKQK